MKKLISVLLLTLITALLCSCDAFMKPEEFTPQLSFGLHMTAKKNNREFEADIRCTDYDSISLFFTHPEELNGFSVTSSEKGFSVNVFGIPDEISDYEINPESLLNVLFETIRTAVFSQHGAFIINEDSAEATLSVDGIPVKVSFSKDGYIREISAESIDFYAQFEKSVDKS